MKRALTAIAFAAAICAALPAAGSAKPPLREVSRIDDGLFHVALANEIRKGCDSIEPRIFKALGVLGALKRHARELGYTNAEIDAFVESEAEKDRMRARGAEFYAARGVDPSRPEDLCALGRAEIARNSQIGVLLRAK